MAICIGNALAQGARIGLCLSDVVIAPREADDAVVGDLALQRVAARERLYLRALVLHLGKEHERLAYGDAEGFGDDLGIRPGKHRADGADPIVDGADLFARRFVPIAAVL